MAIRRPYRSGVPPVGRDAELATLRAALQPDAATDAARTVIVEGEAGMGKTVLVREALRQRGDAATVLHGACLPLVALSVPLLGLRSAFRAIGRGAPRPPAPSFDAPVARVPAEVDEWISHAGAERPVVLFIDDLQWADPDTLDVLLFLIAGPADRPLTILATLRNDEASGRPIDRWLDTVWRMPRVQCVQLGPLDRAATLEHVEQLLGQPPHRSLVEEVYELTDGHPYLTELTVAGVSSDARRLPFGLPGSLALAVTRTVRELGTTARELLSVLAVGGRPMTAAALCDAAKAVGLPVTGVAEVSATLGQAVTSGSAVEVAADTFWFRHPLTAEVLERDLSPPSRRRWHLAFGRLEEAATSIADRSADEAIRIADHFDRAGARIDACRCALSAADIAGTIRAHRQELRMLRRTLAGDEPSTDVSRSRGALLHRARVAAARAGEFDEELDIIGELLRDTTMAPLQRAELLCRRVDLLLITQREYHNLANVEEALELASTDPSSWQYVVALASSIDAQLEGGTEASDEVIAASHSVVATARKSGSARALLRALLTRARTESMGRSDPAAIRAAAEEASGLARQLEDPVAFNEATNIEVAATETWVSRQQAEFMRARRAQLQTMNPPHVFIAWTATWESMSWLFIGEWRECLRTLRFSASADQGPYGDTVRHIVLARLAALQGRVAASLSHLDAASDGLSDEVRHTYDVQRVEVLLGAGKPLDAWHAAFPHLTGARPETAEWLLPLAARACADLVERATAAGDDASPWRETAARLRREHPELLEACPKPDTDLVRAQRRGLTLLYEAEMARAASDAQASAKWIAAVEALAETELPWEEAYACRRAAEALLVSGGARRRSDAAEMIRRGFLLAERLEAEPVITALRTLATLANVAVASADEPTAEPSFSPSPRLDTLTAREREIVEHLGAGRTYAQIAAALFVSEKTVSSHISNALRKTGTANRFELAHLLTRQHTARTG